MASTRGLCGAFFESVRHGWSTLPSKWRLHAHIVRLQIAHCWLVCQVWYIVESCVRRKNPSSTSTPNKLEIYHRLNQ